MFKAENVSISIYYFDISIYYFDIYLKCYLNENVYSLGSFSSFFSICFQKHFQDPRQVRR